MKFDGLLFSKQIKIKRLVDVATNTSITFEKAADAAGVKVSTLVRAQKGKMPDLENYYLLCKWLSVPMETFFTKSKK